MVYDPTHPNPPAWASELATGLYCLKGAAARAQLAYDSASVAALSLTSDVARADASTGTDALYAVVVSYDGYARRQATEVLREIAFAHSGLELSLARVWHRAAHAYAYAAGCALAELAAHGRAQLTASHTVAIPAPPHLDEEIGAAYGRAVTLQQAVRPSREPYGTLPWARSAEAWHAFADTADDRLWQLLRSPQAAETASGR